MKIIQDKDWSGRTREVSISDAIESTIEDSSYNGGVAEMAIERTNNAAKILGKLIECLHKRRMLTDNQVKDMLNWRYDVED